MLSGSLNTTESTSVLIVRALFKVMRVHISLNDVIARAYSANAALLLMFLKLVVGHDVFASPRPVPAVELHSSNKTQEVLVVH
jgi:hypothetical protein